MASSTSKRIPSAKPGRPCSVKSCRTVFKSSGLVGRVIMVLVGECLETPQQETSTARPRPVFRVRSARAPPGFGRARLATLAFAPPHPGGVRAKGRKTNYRKPFTPAAELKVARILARILLQKDLSCHSIAQTKSQQKEQQ